MVHPSLPLLRRLHRVILVAGTCGILAACMASTRHSADAGVRLQDLALRRRTLTHVTQSPGVVSRFVDVRIIGDTLYGWSSAHPQEPADSVPIALARVTSIQQFRTSAGLTIVGVLGTIVLGYGLFWAIAVLRMVRNAGG